MTPDRPRVALRTTLPCLLAALSCLAGLLMPSCVSAPTPAEVDAPEVMDKRNTLYHNLIAMLPPEQQNLPEARAEARWLADTAYKAAAGIARVNKPILAGWLNNYLVNSPFHFKERGLCWHYQNDMYRELRRRPLKFFRIGCCVRDHGKGSEHHCVYLCPTDGAWPHAYILDAWRYHGQLKVMAESDIDVEDWEDETYARDELALIYPERHAYPIEHWAKVRSDYKWKIYVPSGTEEGRNNRQGKIMRANMEHGLQERNGKLTNY